MQRTTIFRLGLLGASIASVFAHASVQAATLSVLTYNVAGLPLGLSSSTPEFNTVLISPLLNAYDIAAVQEDFGFHDDLVSAANHPHQSVKDTTDSPDSIALGVELGLGDGLNRFSNSAFASLQRVTWDMCFGVFDNGADCLAPKGFSVARHEIEPGAFVDIYNFHADASDDTEDLAVRRGQMRQLVAFAQTFSEGRAVIMLGDTNSRYTREGDILPELVAELGLTDVWVELTRSGDVPPVGPKLDACILDAMSGGDCERVDKIFYRSGLDVALTATDYDVPDPSFRDDSDVPLSDHEPVVGVFDVVFMPEPSAPLSMAAALLGLWAVSRASPRR